MNESTNRSNSTSMTLPVRMSGGYSENPWHGGSIQPMLNPAGDTVRTGVQIRLSTRRVAVDSLLPPIRQKFKVREKVLQDHTIRIPDKLPADTFYLADIRKRLGEFARDTVTLTGTKDTLPSGVRLMIKGEVRICRHPSPVKSLPPSANNGSVYNIRFIGTDQGMRTSRAGAVFQDSRGDLWIGTDRGVSRYDGVSIFTYGEKEGFVDVWVNAIQEARNGVLWFCTNKGLVRFDGTTFIHFSNLEVFKDMVPFREHAFWVATDAKGLCLFEPGPGPEEAHITYLTIREGLPQNSIWSLCKDDDGALWLGAQSTVFRYEPPATGSEWESGFLTPTRFFGTITGVEHDRFGNIWLASTGGGIHRLSVSADRRMIVRTTFTMEDGLPHDHYWTSCKDRFGNIWMGSHSNGVCGIIPGTGDQASFVSYTARDGVPSSSVYGIFQDRNDFLWTCTSGGGACRFKVDSLGHMAGTRYYFKETGLSNSKVNAVLEDDQGNIWLATNGGGVNCLTGFNGREPGKILQLPDSAYEWVFNSWVGSLAKGAGDRIWVGAFGAYRIEPQAKNHSLELTSLPLIYSDAGRNNVILGGGYVNSIHADRSDLTWFGSRIGLFSIRYNDPDDPSVFAYGQQMLGQLEIFSIVEGLHNDLWIGTEDYGLLHLINPGQGEFVDAILYTKKEGLCDNSVKCLLKGSDGDLWAGTPSGLCRLILNPGGEADSVECFTSEHGLSGDFIRSLTLDGDDRLWVATDEGLTVLRRDTTRVKKWDVLKLQEQYGYSRMNYNSNSAFIDSRNHLWLGSQRSLESIDLSTIDFDAPVQIPALSQLEINGTHFDFGTDSLLEEKGIRYDSAAAWKNYPVGLSLPYDASHLTFHFSASERSVDYPVLYSFKIEGLDKNWSKPHFTSIAEFRNIPYGAYTFQVRARGASLSWSEPMEYRFEIRPPWWHTWWARGGYGIFAVVLAVGMIKWRTRSLERHKSELEREVVERTRQIEQEKRRAERSEAIKQQFLANMSHEIRTPMNAVIGMTRLVLEGELNKKQRDYLEKVRKASDNLLHIINDILDLSKMEAGKMELERIDFSLTELLDMVRQTVQYKADEKGIELITRGDPSVPDILLGDPVRLTQVLINLAGNAIKFTEKGSVAIEVTARDGLTRFTVMDTGIGIPEDKLKTVFESFGQANISDTRKYGGTGLGLSISRQLVRLMGGTIGISSRVGSGTTFHFDLELPRGDPERLLQRRASKQDLDGSILDDLKILVADDNEYNRIVARDTLQSIAKVEIVEAENGQVAVDLLDASIDVVLMDVQMPVLSGFDATRRIRGSSNKKIRNTPVLALTASVLRTDVDRCLEAGMNGYIPKPFRTHDLVAGIAGVMGIELRYITKDSANSGVLTQKKDIMDKVTDLSYLQTFCNGDEWKMQNYIDLFIKSAPKFLDDLRDMIGKQDATGSANLIHGFHMKLVMMGMRSLKTAALEIEQALKNGSGIADVRDDLEDYIRKIVQGTEELVNRSG